MGLPVSKNPLITKWSTIFDILENKSEISDSELNQLAQSTGFTVSALYAMLGLDVASGDNTVVKNVNQFTDDGPLLVRNPEDPTKYIINPNFNAGLEILFNGQELVDDKGKKVGKMITKIDLAGTVTAVGRGSGLVKIQIGDNMNSSGWNIVDGKGSDGTVNDVGTTTGRAPEDDGASFSMGNWSVGNDVPFTTSSTITYTSLKGTPTTDTEVNPYKVYTSDAAGKNVITNPTSASIKNKYERDGYVHLNDGDNVWTITVFGPDGTTILRQATVTDTVAIKYFDKTIKPTDTVNPDYISEFIDPETEEKAKTYEGSSTGIVKYTDDSIAEDGIESDVLSPMQIEFNYPSAVGARIIRSFTINLEEIVPNGDRVKVVIELNNNTKDQTLFYLQSATPAIADLTLALSTEKFVYYSGVKYYGIGTTFKLTSTNTSITNLNNQLGIGSGAKLDLSDSSKQNNTALTLFSSITDVATGTFSAPLINYSTAWNNACGYSKDGFAIADDKYITTPSITMVPKNAFSVATAISATNIAKVASIPNCLVNTWYNDSDDVVENFKSETYRMTASLVLWSDDENDPEEISLLTPGNTDLQVIPGIGLCYPSKNYTGFTPSALNYSGCSGERSFIRKFSEQGAYQVLTLTVTHNKHLHASSGTDYLVAGKIRFEFSMDGSTWYNISYAKPQNETTQGTSDSSFEERSTKFVFKAPSGFVNNFFYLRVKMTDNQGIIIKSITWNIPK